MRPAVFLRSTQTNLFVAITLVVCCLATYAQVSNRNDTNINTSNRGNHNIRGKIFLPSGRLPEQRMRVILEVASGGIYAETFSDSVGGFEFRSLPNNNYRVVVPSDGGTFEPAQENMEVSGVMARTFTLQVFLREKERNQPTSSNTMVSVAEFTQDVPKAARKSYEQGLKKLKENKAGDAIKHFQDALKEYPDYVLALNKVGEHLVYQKQNAEAEKMFQHAIEVSPKYPLSHINMGMMYVNLQRYSDAISHLETALSLDESFPMAHVNLGVALLERAPKQAQDLERAERAFGRALALGGTPLIYVHKLLFNLHVRRQDYGKAIAALEVYLKEAPNAPDAPQVQEMLQRVKKAAAQAPAPKP
ncbi:MAG TPA: tetratricopeptide repeat protein [Blastocatellia bacterium]|nr:tetratricopeptide repeat protein [Blastocatellia bacterium]